MPVFRSIILCANPRSGSTMLCDLMTSTGVLGKPASFYRPESIPDRAEQLSINRETGSEEFERAYLAAIQKEGTDANGIFSLRLMWDTMNGLIERLSPLFPEHENDADLFEWAFGHPLYIHLVREDKVAQAISLVRAKQSGQWHLASDGSVRQGAKNPSPVTYDAQAIGREITSLTRDDTAWQTWFAEHGLSPVEITYEALSADSQTVIAELLSEVGHDPTLAEKVEPRTAKMADDDSQRWVARYRQEPR